jgi:drug/metabolite transporter (DMT)-like permease
MPSQPQTEVGINRLFGTILIVLGLVGVIWGGFVWTTHKTLVDTQNLQHQLPLAPLIGVLALAGGAALLLMGRRV